MVSGRRAVIQSAIGEVLTSDPTLGDPCVTLDAASNPAAWVQVTREMINAAYPHTEEPLAKLESLGLSPLELVTWEPKQYATFHHVGVSLEALAAFVGWIPGPSPGLRRSQRERHDGRPGLDLG